MNFSELTTPTRVGPHSFRTTFLDGWQQGKGAFGGLVLASMVRATAALVDDRERRLRAVTAELFAPAKVGEGQIDVTLLRVGTSVSTLSALLSQGDEPVAHMTAIFGRSRGEGAPALTPPAPARPSWRDVFAAPVGPPLAPRFSQHFEYRVTGNVPMSGAASPETDGFIRALDPGPIRDAAYVVALADAYWPSFLVSETAPRMISTVAFTLELVSDLVGLDPEAPLFHRGRCVAGAGGYLVDFRELWGEDGRLVALNQQTFVVSSVK